MKEKILIVLCLVLSLSLHSADWPQFLGPDRTGKVIDKISKAHLAMALKKPGKSMLVRDLVEHL